MGRRGGHTHQKIYFLPTCFSSRSLQHVAALPPSDVHVPRTQAGSHRGGRRDRGCFGISRGLTAGENHLDNTGEIVCILTSSKSLLACDYCCILTEANARHWKVNRNYSHFFRQPACLRESFKIKERRLAARCKHCFLHAF